MSRNPEKSWDDMTTEEKLEHLAGWLENVIAEQNASNARIMTRIMALEASVQQLADKDSLPKKP